MGVQIRGPRQAVRDSGNWKKMRGATERRKDSLYFYRSV